MEIENIALQLTIASINAGKIAMPTPADKENNSIAFGRGMNDYNAQQIALYYKSVLKELQKTLQIN
ncbi:MAG: hypothetical protein UH241_02795 [Acutalibacteraceae bacterium]|nr:hypothetical protein [Acutalibacteraceae bacterium]